MRKLSFLFLFVALGLFTTTTFAQEIKEEVKAVAKKQAQNKVEVKLSELPEAITKTLSTEFAEFTAAKAYKAKKDNADVYYVKLKKDGKWTKVLFDAAGKVLDKKELKETSL